MGANPLEIAGVAQQQLNSANQKFLGTLQLGMALIDAKKNKRPVYEIDPAYKYNIDVLTNTLGLPQSALDLYYRNIGQNTNQGINAILGAGGNANQISSLVGNRNAQFQDIAVNDALQKKQDIAGLIAARLALAEQNDKKWQINKFAPYADKAQAIAAMKAAGIQNLAGSANSGAGATANAATLGLADSLGTQQPTTPNSGVNTNAIIESLRRSNSGIGGRISGNQFAPPTNTYSPQIGQYNQYLTTQPNNQNLDYQSWVNYMLGAQGLNQQTNQYIGY